MSATATDPATNRNKATDAAERSVVASLLRNPGAIDDAVAAGLLERHFRNAAYRMIFAAEVALRDRDQCLDSVTLAEELNRRGQIDDIGGYGLLGELLNYAPTGVHAVKYAGLVRDAAQLRGLFEVGLRIARTAEAPPGSTQEAIEEAERLVLGVAEAGDMQAKTMAELVSAACDRIDDRAAGNVSCGLPTGLTDVDELLTGLQDGELIVIGARPSVGKTSFAVNFARNVSIRGGIPALFVSLEQSSGEIVERLLCCEGGINSHRLRKPRELQPNDWDRLTAAKNRLRDSPLYIEDEPNQTAARIAANVRRLRAKHKIRLVVIDYLALIEPENRKAQRHEQVGAAARRLKGLARETKIPVVVLAQLNREVENRPKGRPRLADLRDTGEVEQHADVVLLLHRPPAADVAGRRVAEVIVANNRNGRTGETLLDYFPAEMRFADCLGIPTAPYSEGQ